MVYVIGVIRKLVGEQGCPVFRGPDPRGVSEERRRSLPPEFARRG